MLHVACVVKAQQVMLAHLSSVVHSKLLPLID